MIILGDARNNYSESSSDKNLKMKLEGLLITFFCIHGNREQRPEAISTYIEKEWHDGIVYVEEDYPTLLFAKDWEIDLVLTHTVPLKYEPTEVFLSFIDQDKVDKKTEIWLDTIENKLKYKKWYAGHYHTEKKINKVQLMYNNIEELRC